MTFKNLSPMLYTKDLHHSIDFYTSILGFKCDTQDSLHGWASLKMGNIQIMLALPNDHIPFEKAHFTGSFYFYVENALEVWNQIKDKVKVCYPIEDFDYGMREFAIYDNNGYMLQFGEEIE